MPDILLLAFAVLAFMIAFGLFWGAIKHVIKWTISLVINSALGLIMIYILNMLGLGIPVNWATMLVVALFGLPAVAILAILSFFKMI